MIDKLKLCGAKIKYSRKPKTFYYIDDDFDMKTSLKVEIIHKGEAKKIYGSTTFSKKMLPCEHLTRSKPNLA